MRVDGGAMLQVSLYPPSSNVVKAGGKAGFAERKRRAYLSRNSGLDADWAQVERKAVSIRARAISSLINTRGVENLYWIYTTTQRDGVDFNLAYIAKTFNAPQPHEFDTEYMGKLFAFAYDQAAKGYVWDKTPPGLGPVDAGMQKR